MNLIKLSSAVNYIVFAVSVFAAFVNFVVRSAAYFEFAKFKGLRLKFLAFVPFLQYFILGKVCDDFNLKKGDKTSNSFWLVFFGVGFCVPSALSYIFPKLPLFTFDCSSSRVYLLNCILFLFNFFYIFFYVDCLRVVLVASKVVFRKFVLVVLAFFIILGLDFFVSLFLFSVINRSLVLRNSNELIGQV